jgi:hypothetical protein
MLRKIVFFIVGFIIASALAILGLSFAQKKNYETKALIAIKIENPSLSGSLDSLMDNAVVIAESNKTFDQISETDSATSGTTYQENAKIWKDILEIKRIRNSSLLEVGLTKTTSEESQEAMQKFIPVFLGELGQFYNIKTEARGWIFEEPVTLEKKLFSLNQVAGISFIFGIVFGLILALTLGKESAPSFKRGLEKLQEDLAAIKRPFVLEQSIQLEKPIEESLTEIKPVEPEKAEEKKPEPKKIVPETKPEIIETSKSSSAPANLPVAHDDVAKLFGAVKDNGYKIPSEAEKAALPKEEKPAIYREATPEEVKARLNKLLGGL